ncbi:MIT family Mg2+ and Co2+ transporter [Fructilactobacillus fructivorans]|nr:MIT family Mg2+ and Co2+ transporter [Fructilactobacillus fructivorans]
MPLIKIEKINDNINWIKTIDCRPADKEILKTEYHLNNEMLYYALDRHERPRVEYYDDEGVLLFIFDVAEPTRFNGDVSAEPIGIITHGNMLFTFTADKTNFVNELISSIVKKASKEEFEAMQPIDVINKTLYQLSVQYFDYINQINSVRTNIQRNLRGKANKSAINHLLNLQTDLVYFLTSLGSNNDMINDFKRRFTMYLTEDQKAAVEDISIELQQGLSMAEMANAATQQVTSAYSNLLDSDLNNTIKFLTVFSLILSVPNIVFGFYGENVKLPFMDKPSAWIITIIITIIFIIIVLLFLRANHFFKN